MKKKNISILLNVLLIVFEIIAFSISYNYNHRFAFEFYTDESNLLALVSSIIFVIYLLFNKNIPYWLKEFKYLATVSLMITFLIVLFILTPMGEFRYDLYMFSGSMLFHHTICPLISVISFLYFDSFDSFNKRDSIISLSFTFIYSIVLILLNIFDKIVGPYPFLMVKSQGFAMSIIWLIIIYSFAYLISSSLRIIHNKIKGDINEKRKES